MESSTRTTRVFWNSHSTLLWGLDKTSNGPRQSSSLAEVSSNWLRFVKVRPSIAHYTLLQHTNGDVLRRWYLKEDKSLLSHNAKEAKVREEIEAVFVRCSADYKGNDNKMHICPPKVTLWRHIAPWFWELWVEQSKPYYHCSTMMTRNTKCSTICTFWMSLDGYVPFCTSHPYRN